MPRYKKGKNKDGVEVYFVRVNYTDVDGEYKTKSKTVAGIENAKTLERQFEREIEELKNAGRKDIKGLTVQQVFDEWIQYKGVDDIKKTSIDKHRRNFQYYILPMIANKRIDKLNTAILMDWRTALGEQKKTNGELLSVSTKKGAYTSLRAMIGYAIAKNYITENPLKNVKRFKDANGVRKKMTIYTDKQFKRFIQVAKQEAERHEEEHNDLSEWNYYVFFNILFFMGVRKGEGYAFDWDDIDNEWLTIERSITQRLKGGDVETGPKTKSSYRTLQIPKPLIAILNEHKKRQQMHDELWTTKHRICGYGVRCIRNSTLQRRNEKYAKMAGLHTIRIHDFRHSHVSVLANAGINIKEVAKRLGHDRVEMTWNTYAHMYDREHERAISVLDMIA